MNLDLILIDYDKKNFEAQKYVKNINKIIENKNDIKNNKIIFNGDKVFNIFELCYIIKKKNDSSKFYWSWSDINTLYNNNNVIKNIFEYGLSLIIDKKNNNLNKIKYFLINSGFYVNSIELDLILAVSLYIINGKFIFSEEYDEYIKIFIIKDII